jgi:hypothetical protein
MYYLCFQGFRLLKLNLKHVGSGTRSVRVFRLKNERRTYLIRPDRQTYSKLHNVFNFLNTVNGAKSICKEVRNDKILFESSKLCLCTERHQVAMQGTYISFPLVQNNVI